jgi:hypothetical protein
MTLSVARRKRLRSSASHRTNRSRSPPKHRPPPRQRRLIHHERSLKSDSEGRMVPWDDILTWICVTTCDNRLRGLYSVTLSLERPPSLEIESDFDLYAKVRWSDLLSVCVEEISSSARSSTHLNLRLLKLERRVGYTGCSEHRHHN